MAMSTRAAVIEAVEHGLHSMPIRPLAGTIVGVRHASLGDQLSFLVKVVIRLPEAESTTSKEAAQLVQSVFDPLCSSLPA